MATPLIENAGTPRDLKKVLDPKDAVHAIRFVVEGKRDVLNLEIGSRALIE